MQVWNVYVRIGTGAGEAYEWTQWGRRDEEKGWRKVEMEEGTPMKDAACNRKSMFTVTGNGMLHEWVGVEKKNMETHLLEAILSPMSFSRFISGDGGSNVQASENYFWATSSASSVVCFPPLVRIARVCCGAEFTIAAADNGAIYSWGENNHGQLGLGHCEIVHQPQRVECIPEAVTHISAGFKHCVAITASGVIYSWGCGRMGQLGTGEALDSCFPLPFVLPISSGQTSGVAKSTSSMDVSCGYEHSLLLDCEGTVWAWGGNSRGQLGISSIAQSSHPIKISALQTRVTCISAGAFHSVCITFDSSVFSWGANQFGQLGIGDTIDRLEPNQIHSLDSLGVLQVACGGDHTLCITSIFCCLLFSMQLNMFLYRIIILLKRV